MIHLSLTVLLACCLHFAIGKYLTDEVHSSTLPGWPSNVQLPSRQFSGYLEFQDEVQNSVTVKLHYWLVEAEIDQSNAPLVTFYNGGPGCSSLDSFFFETGPFELEYDNNDAYSYSINQVRLKLRKYRWNRSVNMLYIEAPSGVGFSYRSDEKYATNDDKAAIQNRMALESFYDKFPEYKSKDFYITGESYAGIYIPTLAEEILMRVDDNTWNGGTLKGIGVGNGCTGSMIGICGYETNACDGLYYDTIYLLGLPMVSEAAKTKVTEYCDWSSCMTTTVSNLSKACISAITSIHQDLGLINIYDVYGECLNSDCGTQHASASASIAASSALASSYHDADKLKQTYGRIVRFSDKYSMSAVDAGEIGMNANILGSAYGYGPTECIDSAIASTYLMTNSVMNALHVVKPSFCWTVCGRANSFKYTMTRENLPRDTYPGLINRLNVVIFNGDADACVPYTDNLAWTNNMAYPVITNWSPWVYSSGDDGSKQIGGYQNVFKTNGTGSFTFLTVKGAGHMVPSTNPAAGAEILARVVGIPTSNVYYDADHYSDVTKGSYDSTFSTFFTLIVLLILVTSALIITCIYSCFAVKRLTGIINGTSAQTSDTTDSNGGSTNITVNSSKAQTYSRLDNDASE